MPAKHCKDCEVLYPHRDEFDKCPACGKYTINRLGETPDDAWETHLARTIGRAVELPLLTQGSIAEWNGEWYIHDRVLRMNGYAGVEGTIVRVAARTEGHPDIFCELMGRAGKKGDIEIPGWWIRRVDAEAEAERFGEVWLGAG